MQTTCLALAPILGLEAASCRLYLEVALNMLAALLAGGAIGSERGYHGRPAGLRTHALVCLASCLLMLLTLHQGHWFDREAEGAVTMDPTRMAQGIMTGIGFLGAGVIFRDGLSVRGLTTAASIWITAAIGVVLGVGFFIAGLLATLLTLAVLTVLNRVEDRLPAIVHAELTLRMHRDQLLHEDELRAMLARHHCSIAHLGYRLDTGDAFAYRLTLRTARASHLAELARTLTALAAVQRFSLSTAGD